MKITKVKDIPISETEMSDLRLIDDYDGPQESSKLVDSTKTANSTLSHLLSMDRSTIYALAAMTMSTIAWQSNKQLACIAMLACVMRHRFAVIAMTLAAVVAVAVNGYMSSAIELMLLCILAVMTANCCKRDFEQRTIAAIVAAGALCSSVMLATNLLTMPESMLSVFKTVGIVIPCQIVTLVTILSAICFVFLQQMNSQSSKTKSVLVIGCFIIASLSLGSMKYSLTNQTIGFTKILSQPGLFQPRLIESIHQDYFVGKSCTSKYTTNGESMTQVWENRTPTTAFINTSCHSDAKDFYERQVSQMLTLISITMMLLCATLESVNLNTRKTLFKTNQIILTLFMTAIAAVSLYINLAINSNEINPAYRQLAGNQSSAPNPIFKNSVEYLQHSYQVSGHFDIASCQRAPIIVASTYGHDMQESYTVGDDCTFSFLQNAHSTYIAYTQMGKTNVIDLSFKIMTPGKQSIDLGELPLLNPEITSLKNKFSVLDLVTLQPIDRVSFSVTANHKNDQPKIIAFSTTTGDLEMSNGYHSVLIKAAGYRPQMIDTADLLNQYGLTIYLMKESEAGNLIHLKDSKVSKIGLRVQFIDQTNYVTCTIDRSNPICPGGYLIKRFDSLSNIYHEYVLFNSQPGIQAVPSVYTNAIVANIKPQRMLQEDDGQRENIDSSAGAPENQSPAENTDSKVELVAIDSDAQVEISINENADVKEQTGTHGVYTVDGKTAEYNDKATAVIEVSGFEETSESENASSKTNWRTGEVNENPWDKTIEVNTVMSNYLIFAPNITSTRPMVLDGQDAKVVKLKGHGDTFWYVISYKDTVFVVITDGNNHPAEIRLPNGISTVILTQRARQILQHETVFATVVDSEGKYFSIDDNMWERISNVDEAKGNHALPSVDFLSSNVLKLDKKLNGKFLASQVLQLEDSGFTKALLALASGKDTEKVTGRMYSSELGYKLMSVQSRADKGKQDVYRVCVYCLIQEVQNTQFQITIGGKTYQSDTVSTEDFEKVDTLFTAFLQFAIHRSPHNTFIDQVVQVRQSLFIMNEIGQFKQLTKSDIEGIVSMTESQKLKNVWLTEFKVDRLAKTDQKEFIIITADKIYELDTMIVGEYTMEEPSYFEPELLSYVNTRVEEYDYGMKDLFLEDSTINQMYEEGRIIPGLFLKSSNPEAEPAWPFILVLEDSVVVKYHVNIAMIQVAYAMENGLVDNYKYHPFVNGEAEDLLKRWKPVITRANENRDPLENKHVVYFQNKEIELPDKCMEAFFNMKVPGSFKKIDKAAYRLRVNRFYYKHDNSIYIYNFEPMRHKLLEDGYKNSAHNDTVHECLEMDIVSTDPNLIRRIWVDERRLFEGFCRGSYVNNSKCDGTFRGKYRTGCVRESGDKVKCENSEKDFSCEGNLNGQGCIGKYNQNVNLNHTKHSLDTEGSYSVVDDLIDHKAEITLKNKDVITDIKCETSYNDNSKTCVKADAIKQITSITNQKFSVHCEGEMNAETFECKDGAYDLVFCDQEKPLENLDTCSSIYISRHCENGGNFDKCLTSTDANKETLCIGGVWDGNNCKLRPMYIIIDEHTYITGKCDGTYLENKACIGNLKGDVISCPDIKLNSDNLCQEDPIDHFECQGKTTKIGCEGSYRSKSSIGNNKFALSIQDSEEPIGLIKSTKTGSTSLLYLSKDSANSNVVDIKINCTGVYDDENKICAKAIYESIVSDGNEITREQYTCEGKFNLNDLKCESEPCLFAECKTRYPNLKAPVCNGTFDQLSCGNGGTKKSCATPHLNNENIHCNGLWNGKTCYERPLYIILNNAAYVTGICTGEYTENNKCEGTMKGKVILCKPGLNPDNLCEGPTIDIFTCEGTLTKNGCEGMYSGTGLLRNAKFSINTEDNSFITLNKIQEKGKSVLAFIENEDEYLIAEPEAEYTWNQMHSECDASFSNSARICSKANFNGVMQFEKNQTHIEVHCAGKLQMYPLTCDSGDYTVKYCNTTAEPYDANTCNGTYTELSCNAGGNLTNCYGNDDPIKNIYCNGTYHQDSANCEGFVPPTFSIIKVNETFWLKGVCSNHILDNSCNGLFDKGSFVSCSGDPLNNEEDFKACALIKNEAFGTCNGITNSSGCFGTYSHPIKIEKKNVLATNGEGDHHYDFTIFDSPISFSTVDGEIDIQIECQEGFNPKLLNCKEGKAVLLIKNPADERPGVTIRRTASCKNGDLMLKHYVCAGEFDYSACFGKSVVKGGAKPTCLGDYISTVCLAGGSENGCSVADSKNAELHCLKSYYDGEECSSLKNSENTDIIIHAKTPSSMTDEYGRDVKIAEFEIEKFTMINAEVTSATLDKSIIKSMEFQDAMTDSEGSLHKIKALQNTRTPISLDEGHLERMVFNNFMLDELQYAKFATDDSCKLVHIKFEELEIQNVMLQQISSRNAVIRHLSWSDKSLSDFGSEKISMDYGFGTVILRNIEVYLPYISKAVIKDWMTSQSNQRSVSIVVPQIKDLSVPKYKLHFNGNKTDIFLEFPEFIISDKSIDLILMSDYILSSNDITAKPSIVEDILRGYEEDSRIEAFEQSEHRKIAGFSTETTVGQADSLNGSDVENQNAAESQRTGSSQAETSHVEHNKGSQKTSQDEALINENGGEPSVHEVSGEN